MSVQWIHWVLAAIGAYAVLWRFPRWAGRRAGGPQSRGAKDANSHSIEGTS
jgi:hypothetical protein